MAQDIVIGGRLHSAATGNTVAGTNEILDDAKGKKQNVINQEVDNEIGSDSAAGTIKGRIKNLETAVGSGGSVDERIAETKAEIIGDAAADYNTLGKVEDKIQETKSEILGDAASDYNTLGKVEDKIQAETSRAEAAEGALDAAKANKAITLEGYGITDAYTKSETYNKTEVNGLVDTPHQNYVTVLTYAALIAIDPGSTDTIYRVSNYDGSVPQVDVTKYSEYAWDGTQYVFLCVKSQIDEVFDISVYNNNATYADLAAALGTDGANVPQTLRRGGMSVKFVHSVDNKYVQYRLMSDLFNTTVANWQGVDDEPTAGSDNLVKSGGLFEELYDIDVKDGYYIDSNGTLLQNSNWFVAEYELSNPLQVGDVIVWTGVTADISKCITSFTDGVFSQAWGATGYSRTITITPEMSAVGSNSIKASFLISEKNNASISINGSVLQITSQSKFDAMQAVLQALTTNLENVNKKTFTNYFRSSEIDTIVTPGIYRRDPSEPAYSSYLLLVFATDSNIVQQLKIEARTDIGILMHRSLVNNTWTEWEPAYLPNVKATVAALNNLLPITSDACYKSVHGEQQVLTLDAMEIGSITDQGIDYPNTTGFRTPNNAKLAVTNKQVLIKCNIEAIRNVLPNCSGVGVRIACYNGYEVSLGRLNEQHSIPIGTMFNLLQDTRYIRLIFYFFNADGTDTIVISDYISQLNANLSSMFQVIDVTTGIDLMQQQTYELQSQILGKDTSVVIPKQHCYVGESVNLNTNRFNVSEFMTIGFSGNSGQGCIVWDDYLLVGGDGGYINVYNLQTKTFVTTITLSSQMDTNHVNNLSWGIQGDVNNQHFPKYLYISETFQQCRLFVENFTLNGSTLVQTISFTGTPIGESYQYAVDSDAGYLYQIGDTESYLTPSTNKIKIRKFRLPSISEGSEISLTDADILSEWEYPATINDIYITQGCLYHNGKLYLCSGGYDNGQGTMPHKIFVIDLMNGTVVSIINTQPVFEAELEACCVYNNTMLLCYPNQQKVLQAIF